MAKLKDTNWALSQTLERIKRAVATLKQEFFGIDDAIDQLACLVTPFVLDPHQFADRPLVINLWGMTGVGKTELISRLLELLDLKDSSAYFDMGEYQGGSDAYDLRDKLKALHTQRDERPRGTILIFDEIQHIRTINEDHKEVSNPAGRVLWEIVDKGCVTDREFSRYKQRVVEGFMRRARHAILQGMTAKANVVGSYAKEWRGLGSMNWIKQGDKGNPHMVPVEQMMMFASMYPDYFAATIPNSDTIIGLARGMDPWGFFSMSFGDDTLEMILHKDIFCKSEAMTDQTTAMSWLENMIANRGPQEVYTFKPLMIVVMGNLDEAYTMAMRDLGHEASVESVHMASLAVTLSTIKNTLMHRFRAEQIARLGHNHVIYPALTEDAYRAIIDQQAEKAEGRFKKTYGIQVVYDESVRDLIYYEVVAPAQGARCVITGASALLDSYAPQIAMLAREHDQNSRQKQKLKVSYDDDAEAYIVCGKDWIDSLPVKLQIKTKRSMVQDEGIYNTAVHEAGHAVAITALTGQPPKQANCVYSVHSLGSVTGKYSLKMSRRQSIAGIAGLLAGREAEVAVFGKDCASTGAISDIQRATHTAYSLVALMGLGEHLRPTSYRFPCDPHLYQFNSDEAQLSAEQEASKLMEEGRVLAEQTIKDNLSTLLRLAKLLIEKKRLNDRELDRFFSENPLRGNCRTEKYQSTFERAYAENVDPCEVELSSQIT